MGRARIGIDVGGTFTDLVLLEETGATTFHKLPSTPKTAHVAPINGIVQLLNTAKVKPQDVEFVGLGTTVATNMLLERKGAPTGLITTEGFRDLLEIARQKRPVVFDPFTPKPAPLIPREHRLGVRERVTFDGGVLVPLAESDVVRAAMQLRGAGIVSVAICFLHSYANPSHEQRAAELVRDTWPDVHLVTSEALIPEFREYERLTTTVLNAYLLPGMRDYLAEFAAEVRALGIAAEPLIMSSSGGALRALLAARRPVDTLFSGPSGGVSGATFVSALAGVEDTINFDMGGTSTEVCVVHGRTPEFSYHRDIEGIPVRSTAVAVHTIGAGGSSIARIDEGGLLHVGPESVGADPGPACYGRGGTQPTVTDANVVLGRLNPEFLLGGTLPIDARAIRNGDRGIRRQATGHRRAEGGRGDSRGFKQQYRAGGPRGLDQQGARSHRLHVGRLWRRRAAPCRLGGRGTWHFAHSGARRSRHTVRLRRSHQGRRHGSEHEPSDDGFRRSLHRACW